MLNDVVNEASVQDTPRAKPAGPCALVIFGAGGDLTKRLVVPALYNLATSKLLPANFALVGLDIADLSTDQWRENLFGMMRASAKGSGEFQAGPIDSDVWGWLAGRMRYLRGDFSDNATFVKLRVRSRPLSIARATVALRGKLFTADGYQELPWVTA